MRTFQVFVPGAVKNIATAISCAFLISTGFGAERVGNQLGVATPANQPAETSNTGSVTRLDFEDDSYKNFFEITHNGKVSVTTEANEVIEGKRSLVIDCSETKGEWHMALRAKPGLFKPNQRYTVKLVCRLQNLSDPEDEFFCNIRPLPKGNWVPPIIEQEAGMTAQKISTFINDDTNVTVFNIGMRKQERVVIDSIEIIQQNRLSPETLTAPGEHVRTSPPYEPFGICVHADRVSNTPFGYTDETVKKALDMCKDLGVQWMRISVGELFHDRKSALNGICNPAQKARTEMLIKGLKKRGIHFYVITGATVPWYKPSPENVDKDYPLWAIPCPGSKEYQIYIEAIAKQYAKASDYWEIGNEMDGEFWAGSPELFMKNLTITRAILKKYNPNVRIIMGGLAGDGISGGKKGKDQFLQRLYNNGLKARTDILAFHLYKGTVEEDIFQLNRSISVMARNGDAAKPIWITETGKSMAVRTSDGKWVYDKGQEKEQADYLRDIFTVLLKHPNVGKVFWWNFKALKSTPDQEAGLALVGHDLAPRQAYAVFKSLPKPPECFINRGFLRIDGLDGSGKTPPSLSC